MSGHEKFNKRTGHAACLVMLNGLYADAQHLVGLTTHEQHSCEDTPADGSGAGRVTADRNWADFLLALVNHFAEVRASHAPFVVTATWVSLMACLYAQRW